MSINKSESLNNKNSEISFTEDGDTFSFLKGEGKVLLKKMVLESKKVILDQSIYIGIDKVSDVNSKPILPQT